MVFDTRIAAAVTDRDLEKAREELQLLIRRLLAVDYPYPAHLKHNFVCAGEPTSLGLYELQLNGERVGEAYFTPGWTDYNYNDRVQVQTYDVTDLIGQQHNRITATVGEGWYRGYLGWQKRKDTYGDTNALLVQIKISYEDGRTEIIPRTNGK